MPNDPAASKTTALPITRAILDRAILDRAFCETRTAFEREREDAKLRVRADTMRFIQSGGCWKCTLMPVVEKK